ncbi:MAG: hypothetical protein RJA76_96 [Bacteroidota bacterium]|jgi:succinate dehydrogenase / fumarate reductase cytochrome b subunit
MSWLTKSFSSSLGKKLLMAVTGLFLISFLIIHCSINALVFLQDGGETFNKAAEFMATNPLIRTMEIVLFLGLIVHIVDGLRLHFENKSKRPIAYAVVDGKNSTWYSRSMGLLGTLLLLFLVLHLSHFWFNARIVGSIPEEITMFNKMKEVFVSPFPVIVYVLGCGSLAYHLMHGFQSAFQTIGWNHPKYTPAIKWIGNVYAILVSIIFAAMPIAFHFNLIQ